MPMYNELVRMVDQRIVRKKYMVPIRISSHAPIPTKDSIFMAMWKSPRWK